MLARRKRQPDALALLGSIEERLVALRALAPEKRHPYEVGKTWSEAELADFERRGRLRLPAETGSLGALVSSEDRDRRWAIKRLVRDLPDALREEVRRAVPPSVLSELE